MARRMGLIIAAGLALCLSGTALATVYYSKDEALELAFGSEAVVEPLALFLDDAQTARIEQLARAKLDSQLYTFYVGKRAGQVLGYAAIESHTVRTHPEALLIVLSPSGTLQRIEVLAFHEPPEYQPPARWYAQWLGKPLDTLRLGNGVDAVSGATLSSQAAVDSARKVLALYQIGLAPGAH